MISIKNVSKRFASEPVLNGVSLEISDGEVVAIIGPSGAGKSTLLRCINGLETYSEGELEVNGKTVRGSTRQLRELRKDVGMVFQSFNLFPHMTALRNVALGPA